MAIISEHEKVKEAIVVVKEEAVGDKRLVAYVVGEVGQIEAVELRSYLSRRLPEYMMPNAFMILERFPLLPNSKINRSALPPPEWGNSSDKLNFIAPRTPTELSLAEAWKQVLNVDQVSVLDNFFEIGGHSLLATQVITRINRAFDLSMPLRILFEKTNIADLAVSIEEELIKEIAKLDIAEAGGADQ